MAFDGITIANLVREFKDTLEGGRISKIAQPEKDELLITIKNNRENYRLQISASASLPLIYLTNKNKTSPLTAPNFCMLDVYKRQDYHLGGYPVLVHSASLQKLLHLILQPCPVLL